MDPLLGFPGDDCVEMFDLGRVWRNGRSEHRFANGTKQLIASVRDATVFLFRTTGPRMPGLALHFSAIRPLLELIATWCTRRDSWAWVNPWPFRPLGKGPTDWPYGLADGAEGTVPPRRGYRESRVAIESETAECYGFALVSRIVVDLDDVGIHQGGEGWQGADLDVDLRRYSAVLKRGSESVLLDAADNVFLCSLLTVMQEQ